MTNNIGNYSEEKKDRKKIIIAILLVCMILLIIGMVAAYYSHVIEESGDITTGTLKIRGSYTYEVNGVQTQLEDINLLPGDAVVIKGTITNDSNSSAWIRDFISFSETDSAILPYLKVYLGEFSKEALASEDLSAYALQMNGEQAVSVNKVIDGYGTGADAVDSEDYKDNENYEDVVFLGTWSYEVNYTIYFLPTAANDTQGKTIGLIVGAQALQFKNNNSSQPGESAWTAVSSAG